MILPVADLGPRFAAIIAGMASVVPTSPPTTLAEFRDRFAAYRASCERRDGHVERALLNDLTALVERERAGVSVGKSDSAQPTPASVRSGGQIADALRANPTWSDRRIARAVNCSPTTAGRVRRAIGAAAPVRSVQRGGRMYAMTVGGAS